MKQIEAKSLNTPDEVRTFDKGKVEIINIAGRTIWTGNIPSRVEMVFSL